VKTLKVVKRIPAAVRPDAVAFSPDGKRLAIGYDDGRVAATDLEGNPEWEFKLTFIARGSVPQFSDIAPAK
jgi:DNA-binding beta-propeller fold protein YncE